MASARMRVIARLEGELNPVAHAAVGALRQEVPANGELRGPQLDDVRAIAYRVASTAVADRARELAVDLPCDHHLLARLPEGNWTPRDPRQTQPYAGIPML